MVVVEGGGRAVATRRDGGRRLIGVVVLLAVPLHAWGASSSHPRSEGESGMKYVVTWRERPTGSVAEYEAAQQRVLGIFSRGEMPESLTFHQFPVRLGDRES